MAKKVGRHGWGGSPSATQLANLAAIAPRSAETVKPATVALWHKTQSLDTRSTVRQPACKVVQSMHALARSCRRKPSHRDVGIRYRHDLDGTGLQLSGSAAFQVNARHDAKIFADPLGCHVRRTVMYEISEPVEYNR